MPKGERWGVPGGSRPLHNQAGGLKMMMAARSQTR